MLIDGRALAVQQQELLEYPAVDNQQDLDEVVDAEGHNKTTDALPAAQPKIPEVDEHYFRLRRIRSRLLAGRHTRTT